MSKKKFNKNEMVEKLLSKGADQDCHRCGQNSFTIMEGYSFIPVNEEQGNILGGPSLPTFLVVCNNCGAITQHALGAFENLKPNGNE